MLDSHLHYLNEVQRHEMERRQAYEYWLHRRLLGEILQKESTFVQSLHFWPVATLSRWWHRFETRESRLQPTERLRATRTLTR